MGPNVVGFVFVLGVILAVPLVLGAAVVLLAGLEGASAGPQLPWGRHLGAAATGGLVGCAVLAGATLVGLYVALSVGAGLAGCFLAIFVASAIGLLAAYRTACALAARLNRYRCTGCGVRFRAPWPAALCSLCAERRAAEPGWLAEFAARLRELGGHGPAGG